MKVNLLLFQTVVRFFKKLAAYAQLESKKIVLGCLCALFEDLSLPESDYQLLLRRVDREGLSFLSKTLPVLEKALLNGLETGTFICPTNFERLGSTALPRFLALPFSRVFDSKGELLSQPDPLSIRKIRQVCSYTYKADLPRKGKLDKKVLSSFQSTEVELSQLRLADDPLLCVARNLVADLFRDYDKGDIVPKHGPGVTSNCGLFNKYEHKLTFGLPSVQFFNKLFFFNEEEALSFDRLYRYPTGSHHDYFGVRNNSASVILVNKDSRGPRLISCEPVENQLIQQGIASYMVNKLERHRYTSGHVNFTSSEVNRDLALVSSVTRAWATLDLKDASDRVSLDLVKLLFREIELGHSLLASRSSYTKLPDGKKVLLAKFAPMGSALCFPVMAVVIWSLLVSSFIGFGMSAAEALDSVYVYGDDIIVPTHLCIYAQNILSRYGLRVNSEKSFSKGHFRESCGADYYSGFDVKPLRLKRVYPSFKWSFGQMKRHTAYELLSHANAAYDYGYYRLFSFLVDKVERILGPLPYGDGTEGYLIKKGPADRVSAYNAEQCERLNLCKRKFAVYRVETVAVEADTSPYGHLYRVFRSMGSSEDPIPFGVFDRPREFNIVKGYANLGLGQP